jgi:hypothetical protein
MPTLHRTTGRARQTTKYVDGDRVHVSIWTDAPGTEYDGRLELNYEAKTERWAFGLYEERTAEFLTTDACPGLASEPELPDWVVDVITDLDLEVEA